MSCSDGKSLLNKRKAENDGEFESDIQKRVKLSPPPEDHDDDHESQDENDELNHGRNAIDDALKTLDRIQFELNMNNILIDSPEASDHDTPPDSEDEGQQEGMLSQAHALGYAACLRETFHFLDSCGIPENDPIYKQLKQRFVEMSN